MSENSRASAAGKAGFAFAPPAINGVPIRDMSSAFPVRRVYCVGRNYAAHAVEVGHDHDREPPFFFQKNPDSLVTDGRFPYPVGSSDVQHEIEMVVALGRGGGDIAEADALDCVFGYGVGLDMTRRDLQGEAKKPGRPWEVGKAFDASAPISAIVPAGEIGHPADGTVWLTVDGVERQRGDLNQMIWTVPEMIAHLSRLFTLAPGDLIYSGSPAGVGPVLRGDALCGHVDGIGDLAVTVV